MNDQPINIRPIQPEDNAAIANIIRSTMAEFGVNKPGTVYFDETTDHLYELFSSTAGSHYTVAEKNGKLVGGAGIFPTAGLPDTTCELVKMYLLSEVRGMGIGKYMINSCLEFARALGYTQVYLETMPELVKAVSVYEKTGFTFLPGPMGNSGHTGCDIWMLKKLF